MEISEIIRDSLKKADRTQRWLAAKLKVDEKTLSGRLKRESIDAKELLAIAHFLGIDLNKLANEQMSMFTWLINYRYQFIGENQALDIEIKEVDSEGNMKIAIAELGKELQTEESKTLHVLISRMKYSFTDFADWDTALYDRLRSTNKLRFFAFRTAISERDISTLEVRRVEMNIKTGEDEGYVSLITYTIIQDSKIVGEPLAFDKEAENQRLFTTWVEKIATTIPPFCFDQYLCFEESQVPVADIDTLRAQQRSKK